MKPKITRKDKWGLGLAAASLALLSAVGGITILAQAQDRGVPPRIIDPPHPIPPIWPPRPFPPVLNQELQLVSQNAEVEIKGAVAKTRLKQVFQNTTNRRVEGTYVFPLPGGASVSGFAMTVNGKRMEAEFLEGEQARKIYQDIVSKLRDPAILEFADRNLIRAKVFPIEPRAMQTMELEYSQPLAADAGSYRYALPLRLPVGGAAERAAVDIKITSPDGIKAVYSPTHEVEVRRDGDTAHVSGEFGNRPENPVRGESRRPQLMPSGGSAARDFVLYYTTSKNRVGVNLVTHQEAGEDGYFMLLLAPDPQIAAREVAAKDVVFVFDTSGSMAGEKIAQARRALQNLLGNLNPDDRFNIVTFSSDVRQFRGGLVNATRENLDAARDWADRIKAVGGTNINEALLKSLEILQRESRPQQIIFMTDGQPTVGETNIDTILENIREDNRMLPKAKSGDAVSFGSSPRIFVFGVGYDVNTQLLDALAEENRGASDYVLPNEDIETKVGSLYNKIAYPVLANPRLDWRDAKVYDVYPKVLPDLFKGTQTIVFGRYEKPGSSAPVLTGSVGNKEERIRGNGDFSKDKNEILPRLWATRKIGYLMDEARRSGRTVDPEVKEEIIQLGKKYGIVTPFTAGLITEDERHIPGRVLDRNLAGAPAMAADAAAGFNGAVSGERAVRASQATKQYREAQTLQATMPQSATLRTIAGKTFELKDGVWTDAAYKAQKSPKVETVKFASPEYFDLARDTRVAQWLSLGERVIVVLDGRTVHIEP